MLAVLLQQAEPLAGAVDGSLVRAVVGTFAVLGLVALLAYLLRRGVLTLPGQRAPRSMAVETALALGERRSLAIVRVEQRRLLLGLTPSQVSVLAELGEAPAPFERALDRVSAPPGSAS
jgi:flagellar protein FliO/FliZ